MIYRISITLFLLTLQVVSTAQCDAVNLTINTQSQLDSFKRLYPECKSLKSLEINGQDITNINGIKHLESIETLIVRRTNIQELNLDFLKSANAIEIDFNDNLSKFHNIFMSNDLTLRLRNNFNLIEIDSINLKYCNIFLVSNCAKMEKISNVYIESIERIHLYNLGGNCILYNVLVEDAFIFEIWKNQNLLVENSRFFVKRLLVVENLIESLSFLDSFHIESDLGIEINVRLSDCNTPYVCSLLVERYDNIKIILNGPGCQNKQQVLESCALSYFSVQKPQTLSIYPNPSDANVFLYTDGDYDDIYVYNQLGQRMPISYSGDQIDISHLPTGMYYLYLTERGMRVSETQKLVKIE